MEPCAAANRADMESAPTVHRGGCIFRVAAVFPRVRRAGVYARRTVEIQNREHSRRRGARRDEGIPPYVRPGGRGNPIWPVVPGRHVGEGHAPPANPAPPRTGRIWNPPLRCTAGIAFSRVAAVFPRPVGRAFTPAAPWRFKIGAFAPPRPPPPPPVPRPIPHSSFLIFPRSPGRRTRFGRIRGVGWGHPKQNDGNEVHPDEQTNRVACGGAVGGGAGRVRRSGRERGRRGHGRDGGGPHGGAGNGRGPGGQPALAGRIRRRALLHGGVVRAGQRLRRRGGL